jgi:two-component system, chemotaxis family, CheB/CheR fusion protein
MRDTKAASQNSPEQLNSVLQFINKERGIDLHSYRQNFTLRHLRSRIAGSKSANPQEYIDYLRENPKEIDLFLGELSINVTHFFRDARVFDAFQNALTELIDRKRNNRLKLIRIWSAGCASGQEAYSLAIMMKETLGKDRDFTVKIWGTDVDEKALEAARTGEYEHRDLREVNKKLLEKYFQPVYNGKYSVNAEIRRMVSFERHNLISDPALRFMDIIFCRNVLIYFTRGHQDELLNKFHRSLNSGGYLVIARVESTWNSDLFSSHDLYNKIYQKAG